MSDILNKTIVLVLNRNWQAIHVRTPQEAFCMMATNVATALEIDGEDHVWPTPRNRRGSTFQGDDLPLSVEVCTPVSETGRAGALPAAAAI